MPRIEVSGPILRIRLSWSRKSSSVNWFLRSLRSSSFASSSSTVCSAFSMNERTSPIPRMRWAMRSGWNRSKSPSFSPVEANMIGLPVTALTDSAAPPRASPSSLESTTPSNCATSANCSATLTASWPVMASTTSSTACGPDPLLDLRELLHQRLVDVQAPRGVDDQHVLAVARGLLERPAGDVDRVLVGPLLVDRRARLGADLDELLDRRRPVDVAGRDRHRRVVLLAQHLGQLGRGRRLARALQAGHQHDGGRARREREPGRGAAHQLGQLLVDDLDDLLAGVELLAHLDAQAALLHGRRELLDDLEVDVRLEQREADLAHRAIDVVLRQRAALADAGQRSLQLL